MENPDTLKGNLESYIEDKVDLVKLRTAEKAGNIFSRIIVSLALARLGLFAIIFLSFSAAFAIAEATGKNYLGFLSVGGFYILVGGILFLMRDKLVTVPIINALLKKWNYGEHHHG